MISICKYYQTDNVSKFQFALEGYTGNRFKYSNNFYKNKCMNYLDSVEYTEFIHSFRKTRIVPHIIHSKYIFSSMITIDTSVLDSMV